VNPMLGLEVFRVLRRLLREPSQMELLREEGALDWFRVCLQKDEPDEFEKFLPPMGPVPV
jgi:hypothetical protein